MQPNSRKISVISFHCLHWNLVVQVQWPKIIGKSRKDGLGKTRNVWTFDSFTVQRFHLHDFHTFLIYMTFNNSLTIITRKTGLDFSCVEYGLERKSFAVRFRERYFNILTFTIRRYFCLRLSACVESILDESNTILMISQYGHILCVGKKNPVKRIL